MEFDVFETDKFLMRIHKKSNYLEFTVKENVTIDEHFVLEAKRVVESHRPDAKFYMLTEGAEFFNITSGARKLSATPEFNTHIEKVAFHTTYTSLKLLGDLYNQINKPVVETRIFNDRDSAKTWLNEQMTKKEAK